MGEMNKIHCHNCGKNWECRSGCGIMHSRLEKIAGLFETDISQRFMVYASEKPPVIFSFSFMMARCDECKEILDVPFLEIKGTQYIGKCPRCAQNVKVIKEIEKANCPKCNCIGLEQHVIGNWD